MLVVTLIFYDESGDEIYGPFDSLEAADEWAATIKAKNDRIMHAIIEKVMTPLPLAEL